jgi:hypothetical protein
MVLREIFVIWCLFFRVGLPEGGGGGGKVFVFLKAKGFY